MVPRLRISVAERTDDDGVSQGLMCALHCGANQLVQLVINSRSFFGATLCLYQCGCTALPVKVHCYVRLDHSESSRNDQP